jgi:hypothetical protein
VAAFFRTWPARSLADLGKTACRPFWTAFLSRWRPLASSAAGIGLVSSLYAIDEAPRFSAADHLRALASGPRIAQICRFSLAGASQQAAFRPAPRLSRAFRLGPFSSARPAAADLVNRAAQATDALAVVVVLFCCMVYITTYNNKQHFNPT